MNTPSPLPPTNPRVIVIGAGPAGIRCAEAFVAAGIRPIMVDEGSRDGGQIYRRQPANFSRSYETLYGSEATRAKDAHDTFERLRPHIDYRPETLVWNVADHNVYLMRDAQATTLPYDALIICSGATDRLMPLPGWELAGTFSLGGAQIALKSQACGIGKRVVFMGTGPLLYLIATQYLKAGAEVAAVLDTSPWSHRLTALPALLSRPELLWKGLRMSAQLMGARVPVHYAIQPIEISGTPELGVRGCVFLDRLGTQHRVECDAIAMGYHLRPETQLADLARCEFSFDMRARQWLPVTDTDGRSSVPGVYLAGDGARIRGADAAEASGRLAALTAIADLGKDTKREAQQSLRATLEKMSRFAVGLSSAFPWPAMLASKLPDHAIVCRCECITAGELRAVVSDKGATEANRAKAFSRVGMGRCQGRYCGDAAAEIIAAAAKVPVEEVGRLRGQAPVKPISLASTTK